MNKKILFNDVLILSPHTDDGELAAGGTINRLIEEGKNVYYVAFSGTDPSLSDELKNILKTECKNATARLGLSSKNLKILDYPVRNFHSYRQKILDELIILDRELHPDLILVPSTNDVHQDHAVLSQESIRAFKKSCSIWGYEHPWNNLTFTTDIFVKLDETNIDKKIESLSYYKSQSSRTYFNSDYIKCLAFTRGMQVDYDFAETFELIRLLLG